MIPPMLFIMLGYLCAFSFMVHFLYGSQRKEFNNLIDCTRFLIEYTMSYNDTEYYIEQDSTFQIIVFIIPFFFIVKYICFNMIVSIMYYGYGCAKEEVQLLNNIQTPLTWGQTFKLSWEVLKNNYFCSTHAKKEQQANYETAIIALEPVKVMFISIFLICVYRLSIT